jgi:HEAT repeat protein
LIAEAGTPVHFLLQVLGDPAAIDSLVKILGNDGAWLVNRTYAAIALGGIVDDELPFHWKIADNLNYRSVVTTLVYRGTGILEIL